MIMQLELDIRESWEKGQQKNQEEYEALVQSHGGTIQRTLGPKRGLTVDVIVTLECIHLYFLSIVTRCLFWDVLMSCHAPMFLSGGSIM